MMRRVARILATFGGVVVVLSTWSTASGKVDTAWVERYFYAEYWINDARAIDLDDAGNVYVTGSVGNFYGPEDFDYATVRYDANGNLVWVRRYDGPAGRDDFAADVRLDHSGNVLVTGSSSDSTYFSSAATLKYSAEGDLLWERRYQSPGGGSTSGVGLEVDDDDNVYVLTGTAVLKYDAGGSLIWATAGGGSHFCRDAMGHIHVAASGGGDFRTRVYDADGNLLWDVAYDGPAGGWDDVADICADDSGHTYVTGYAYVGPDTYDRDYATLKYDADGNLIWSRLWDGSFNDRDEPKAIAIDPMGNIVVTGKSGDHGTLYDDFATLKYDGNGNLLWARQYDGPGALYDRPLAMTIDALGNIYVTGYSYSAEGENYTTVKYDPNGNLLLELDYDGTDFEFPGYYTNDEPRAIAVDAKGQIYVTGFMSYSDTESKYLTIKYVTCDCPHLGDGDADGFVTAVDLSLMVDVLFDSGSDPHDPVCPVSRLDYDCDGFTTTLDLAEMIDYLFAGGMGACLPCPQ